MLPAMRSLPNGLAWLLPAMLALLVLALALALASAPTAEAAGEGMLCQQAIAMAERGSGVPNQLLDAISRVESGRYDPELGTVRAWPWTINAQGQGHFYASKAEAVAAAQAFRSRGVTSIDVGCTQINLAFHPDAFASLDDAFDPVHNAAFAARFLTDLFHQQGSWPHAAAAYHSQTPELGTDYQRKVLEAWSQPIDAPAPRRHEAAEAHGSGSHGPALNLADASFAAPVSVHPFGGGAGQPLGGTGRVIRASGGGRMSGVTGRTLSAYRLMPVFAFRPPPMPTQFRGVPARLQAPGPAVGNGFAGGFAGGFARPTGAGGSLFTSMPRPPAAAGAQPHTPYAMLAGPTVRD